ncbi:Tn3 transposase DDE domain-containing protein [Nonomuraea maritima]|uniref:Tn3 transposase DDE domain-containing protein n=1 Tax=Nonomuraea maritima TaxID=683260 RepID=A0A1G9R6M7_9ACTN|nr:Tn3 transposase DDE domain-containing protein [Nonomuraea maritima]
MEDQLGALGLVLNAVVLWTTRYIDAAVAQLQAEGHDIREEDIARLSPLKHKNLNLLGRYSFTASTPAAGALRPLRNPDAPELPREQVSRFKGRGLLAGLVWPPGPRRWWCRLWGRSTGPVGAWPSRTGCRARCCR